MWLGSHDLSGLFELLTMRTPSSALGMRVIRVDGDHSHRVHFREELGPDVAAALLYAKGNGAPVTFIVQESDVAALLALREVIVHRRKVRTHSLKDYCFGEQLIPLITGEYSDPGQFLRSVRTLQANAIKQADRNVYLVAAGEQIFEALWHAAPPQPLAARFHGPGDPPRSTPGESTGPEPRLALALFGAVEIPLRVAEEYVGASVEVQLVHRYVVRAAANADTVLILGPTGTGKDVVARLIHDIGVRRAGPFVRVNCGHEAGHLFEPANGSSPSRGGSAREALWRAASGGTLFLDEMTALSLPLQARLFDALATEDAATTGSGGTRVLAATNRDLIHLVETGEFREDLYYRMRANVIRTPALREHPDDIPLIAAAQWKKATRDPMSELTAEVMQFLCERPWAGNVRELSICLSALANLFGPQEIRVEHVQVVLALDRPWREGGSVAHDAVGARVHEAEGALHVRQTVDVIRAAQASVRRMVQQGEPSADVYAALAAAIGDRMTELELLGRRRDLYRGEGTVAAVRQVALALRSFWELLVTDPASAMAEWDSAVEGTCERALRVLGVWGGGRRS